MGKVYESRDVFKNFKNNINLFLQNYDFNVITKDRRLRKILLTMINGYLISSSIKLDGGLDELISKFLEYKNTDVINFFRLK